jgi:carbonic anhydrase/acetyltransferase-like protein (isoleucine patch superfamily)
VPIPTTVVKVGGKAPSVGGASFVAPSANLIGAVHMGEGASAWYGSMLKASASSVEIGELSSVGDRAIVVDSVVGKSVHIGAGAIVTGAKLADECSVGMGCKLGKGSSVGSGAALAAGSLLPPGATVPPGQLWGGAPAKYVADMDADSAAGIVRPRTHAHCAAIGGGCVGHCCCCCSPVRLAARDAYASWAVWAWRPCARREGAHAVHVRTRAQSARSTTLPRASLTLLRLVVRVLRRGRRR